MKKINKLGVVVFGALIGLINGFFGGGGGMIVVPMLTKFFDMDQKKAQATALFIILPISLASTIVYLCHKSIDIWSGLPVIVGIVAGGVFGALLLNKLKNNSLRIIFIIFMLVGGIVMLMR